MYSIFAYGQKYFCLLSNIRMLAVKYMYACRYMVVASLEI